MCTHFFVDTFVNTRHYVFTLMDRFGSFDPLDNPYYVPPAREGDDDWCSFCRGRCTCDQEASDDDL